MPVELDELDIGKDEFKAIIFKSFFKASKNKANIR